MNVVLVGYRGTGKSSVAKLLGRTLGFGVVSFDEEIERRAGHSIVQIVEARGWEAFRDLEEQVCRAYATGTGQVLDCGGGVVERDANIEVLRRAGPVVWLTASPQVIVERIQGDSQRPSLSGTKSFTDEVEEIVHRRAPLYDRISDYRVDTEGRCVAEVASDIMRLIEDDLEHEAVGPPPRR